MIHASGGESLPEGDVKILSPQTYVVHRLVSLCPRKTHLLKLPFPTSHLTMLLINTIDQTEQQDLEPALLQINVMVQDITPNESAY
jgi:hypothetical protein